MPAGSHEIVFSYDPDSLRHDGFLGMRDCSRNTASDTRGFAEALTPLAGRFGRSDTPARSAFYLARWLLKSFL